MQNTALWSLMPGGINGKCRLPANFEGVFSLLCWHDGMIYGQALHGSWSKCKALESC